METQINAAKNEAKAKSDDYLKEIEKLKKQKEKLIKEKEESKLETDTENAALKKKYDDQLRDYRKEVDKLQREKLAISEKMFEETRRLTQELYEKDSALQEATGEGKGKAESSSSSKEVSSIKRELKHTQEQHELEKQKLLQERSDVLAAVESQLSAEKKKSNISTVR